MPARPNRTADRYLEVAARLAADGGTTGSSLAAQVPLRDIAHAVGVTRTALYRRWPSQQDLARDLARYLVRADEDRGGRWPAHDGWRQGIPEDLQRHTDAVQASVIASPWLLVRASLLGEPPDDDVAAVRHAIDARRLRASGQRLEQLVAGMGRRFTPPLTSDDVAVVLWCIADSLSVAYQFEPEVGAVRVAVDDGDGPLSWTVLGYAARCLIAEVTSEGLAGIPDRREPPPPSPPPPEWSPQQREALASATELLLDRVAQDVDERQPGPLNVLDHVTVARVARLAGVSRQTVHEAWPSNTELRRGLLGAVLRTDRRGFLSRLDRGLARTSGDHPDAVANVLDELVPRSRGQRGPVDLRLAFLPQVRHPFVRDAMRSELRRLVLDVAERVPRLLGDDSRALRPGVDRRHLAVLLSLQVFGAHRLQRTDPEAFARAQRRVAPGTSALALAFRAIVDHSLEG